jgi:hypothetical protein
VSLDNAFALIEGHPAAFHVQLCVIEGGPPRWDI